MTIKHVYTVNICNSFQLLESVSIIIIIFILGLSAPEDYDGGRDIKLELDGPQGISDWNWIDHNNTDSQMDFTTTGNYLDHYNLLSQHNFH